MSLTSTYKVHREQTIKFAKSMPKLKNIDFYQNSDAYKNWMIENLKLTSFKTVEEAVQFRNSMFETDEKLYKENAETFELVWRASVEQLMEILKPDFYVLGQ